jgi:phosphoglycolate phosphatase-like HAD superfamily hydrolase
MQAILFDIDGTLLSSLGAGKDAMYGAIKEVYGKELPKDSVPFAGNTDRSILSSLIKSCGAEPTEEAFQAVRTVYLKHLPETLQRQCPGVLPGIKESLVRLKADERFSLGLLTGNMEAGSDLKLKRFEIHQYFDFGGWGDHHYERDQVAGMARDNTFAFLKREIPADSLWVIGDTPKDIQCARAIGAKAVGVATGPYSFEELEAEKPDLCLHDFARAEAFWSAINI